MFRAIFDPRSSIVKSVFECRLSGVDNIICFLNVYAKLSSTVTCADPEKFVREAQSFVINLFYRDESGFRTNIHNKKS